MARPRDVPPAFDFIPELADGDCLFRAIARQLRGNSNRFQEIRDALVQRYFEIYSESDEFRRLWESRGAELVDGIKTRFPPQDITDPAYPVMKAEMLKIEKNASARELTEAEILKLSENIERIRQLEEAGRPDFEMCSPNVLFVLYIYFMKYTNMWGGIVELETMANIFDIDIHLHQPMKEPPYLHFSPTPGSPPDPSKRQVYVYYNGYTHYDSLRPRAPGGAAAAPGGAGAGAAAKPGGAAKSRAVSASKVPYKSRITQTILDLMAGGSKKSARYETDVGIIRDQEKAHHFDTKTSLRRWIATNEEKGNFDKIANRYGIEGGGKRIIDTLLGIQMGGARKTKRALRKRKTQKKK